MARARKAAETAEAEATAAGKEKREELVDAAKRDIEAETRRSLEQIRKEVADLTVLATEKVTRKSARRRRPAPPGRGGAQRGRLLGALGVGERTDGAGGRPRIRRGALRGRQGEGQARRDPRASSASSPTPLDGDRDLQVFFFSPYFSSAEKSDGLKRAVTGADPELVNFLELLIEKHRMPEIFRIRRQFDELWKQENKRIDVTVTSAVELDPAVVDEVGAEIERQTGQKVELASRVDEEILGGVVLQVGNMVLDASIRNRLEKLRKSVAQAA